VEGESYDCFLVRTWVIDCVMRWKLEIRKLKTEYSEYFVCFSLIAYSTSR